MKLLLRNNINISIPKPCHENWEAMTPAEKGRFCSVCSKTVLDFTKASDKEIVNYLSNNKNACGRFYNHQLDRDLMVHKPKKSYWFLASISLLGFLGLNNSVALAQNPPKTEQTETKKTNQDTIKIVFPQKKITGVVSDDLGPMPGANVVIIGTNFGTTTDFDGNFTIEVEEGQKLLISYIGFHNKEIIVDSNTQHVSVKLEENLDLYTTGIIETGYKKKTFFGRQIQKVRNWFR